MQEMEETWVLSLNPEDLLEKKMATHLCILVWKIPWTEEFVGLQSMVLQSDTTAPAPTRLWLMMLSIFSYICWWLECPVFLKFPRFLSNFSGFLSYFTDLWVLYILDKDTLWDIWVPILPLCRLAFLIMVSSDELMFLFFSFAMPWGIEEER